MRMLRRSILGFVLATTVLSTGCWDARELNEQGFVTVLSIDKGVSKEYRVTVQVPQTEQLGSVSGDSGGGGSSESPPFSLFTVEGESIPEALSGMSNAVNRYINLSHCNFIVLGKRLVTEVGLEDFVNVATRVNQFRGTAVVAVSEGKAEEIAAIAPQQESNASEYYSDLLRLAAISSDAYPTTLYELVIAAPRGSPETPLLPLIAPVTADKARKPIAGEAPDPTAVALKGMAVFRDDRLVGQLNRYETQGWLLLRGELKNALVPVEVNESRIVLIVREASATQSIKKPGGYLSDSPYSISVEIDVDADIVDILTDELVVNDEVLRQIDGELARALRVRCLAAIRKARKYRTDIFSFSRVARAHIGIPASFWLTHKWSPQFMKADISTQVIAHVRRSGALFGNITVSEQGRE